MAIDEDGGLWIWGNNSNGQSGIYNTTNQSIPMLVSDFPGTTSSNKVKNVYFNTGSQYRVTIIVTETNDVYCAGNDFANGVTVVPSSLLRGNHATVCCTCAVGEGHIARSRPQLHDL